jgi:hypothetical protein
MSMTMFASHGEVKREATGQSEARSRTRSRAPVALTLIPLLLGSVTGCRTAPILDVVDAPLPAVCGERTTEAVDEAIWRAGRKVGWKIERVSPGLLRGTWRFKHHEAVVAIAHADGRFSIRYEKSENLLHEGDQIHRNYKRLVEGLATQIQQEPVAPELDGLCPPSGAAAGTPRTGIRHGVEEVT